MGAHVASQPARQLVGEGDAVAFDGDVDVQRALAQQQVAHGAADQVDAGIGRADGLDVLEKVLQTELVQTVGQVRRRRGRSRRRRPAPHLRQVRTAHHAHQVVEQRAIGRRARPHHGQRRR